MKKENKNNNFWVSIMEFAGVSLRQVSLMVFDGERERNERKVYWHWFDVRFLYFY